MWLLWQVTQPGKPTWAKPCCISVLLNSPATLPWQVPQMLATERTWGGKAPWLPWQPLHAGALKSSLSRMRLAVDALAPIFVLRVAERPPLVLVAGHPLFVRVALGAGLRHVLDIDGGIEVLHRQHPIGALVAPRAVRPAVAGDAGRHVGVCRLFHAPAVAAASSTR